MDWQPITQWRKVVFGEGKRALALVVGTMETGKWTAVALETVKPSGEGAVEQIFDDHGHKVVGEFPNMRKAMAACNSFARDWKKGQKAVASCACDEIVDGKEVLKAVDQIIDTLDTPESDCG